MKHFTTALGSVCGSRYEQVLEPVQSADRFAPDNPFVEVFELVALLETNSPVAESYVAKYLQKHQDHPLPSVLGVQSWK